MLKSGTTNIPAPIEDPMSMNEYVRLPTVVSNGGREMSGRPGFTWPRIFKVKLTFRRFVVKNLNIVQIPVSINGLIC